MAVPKRPKRLQVEKHISKKAFNAIGLLMATCSSSDAVISHYLLRIISRHSLMVHAYPLVAGTEIKTKLNLIRIFLSMYGIDKQQVMGKMLDKIYSLYERRNDFAHAILLPGRAKDEIKIQVLRAKIKTGQMPQPRFIKIAQIRDYAIDLWLELHRFEEAITAAGIPTDEELQQIDAIVRRIVSPKTPESRSDRTKRLALAEALLAAKD